MAKQTPAHSIAVGRGITAAIWANNGENGTWHNITVTRTYKDKDGKLQDTTSFRKNDLPFAEKAAALAFSYVLELEA